jgi:hypothetical protein
VDYYNYNTELPFSNKKIKFREITTKEQLILAKANLSFPNTIENHKDFNDFVFKTIKNCIETQENFENINIIDYILFLTKLRIISIGSIMEFVSESKNSEVKSVKTTLDLNLFLKNLYYGALKSLKNNIFKENDVEVKISWPNVNSIKIFQEVLNKEASEYDIFLETFQEFVEYIKIKDKKIVLNNFSKEQKLKILEKISSSLMKKIQDSIVFIIKTMNETDLWGVSSFNQYTFNIYNLSFVNFIRLFFAYDVKTIYQDIYYMAAESLPPEYVLSLSPAERKVHSSIIIEARKRKEGEQTPDLNRINQNYTSKSKVSKDVQDLALEFGQTPP